MAEATRTRRPSPALLAAIVVAVAAIVAAVLLLGGGDDGEERSRAVLSDEAVAESLREGRILTGPPNAAFAMRYPTTWGGLEPGDLDRAEGPLTGLRRTDRSGLLTVSVRGPIEGGIKNLERTLPGDLANRFPDFRLVSIRRLEVAAGPALYATWVRTEAGSAQSTLVVPDSNRRSFSVDVVLEADARDAAKEVGAMLRTFTIRG